MPTKSEYRKRRAELVAALRSGNYAQIRGQLAAREPHKKYGYCCLGVACEVAAGLGLPLEIESRPALLSQLEREKTYNGQDCTLPNVGAEYYGFATHDGTFKDYVTFPSGERYISLVGANDGGESFEDIATVIESEPAGLFFD